MQNFRIEMTGPGRGKVFMGDQQLECVTRVSFKAATGEPNEITVTMIAGEVVVYDAELVIEPAE